MAWFLIRHKVKDYNKWKTVFDEGSSNRKEMGSKGGFLFSNADDPNEVIVLIEVDDLKKVRHFAQSKALKDSEEQAGVVGQSDIVFIDNDEKISV